MRNITNFAGIKGLTLVSLRAPKVRGKWGITYTTPPTITGARHLYRVPLTFWTKDDAAEFALAAVKQACIRYTEPK